MVRPQQQMVRCEHTETEMEFADAEAETTLADAEPAISLAQAESES